MFNMQKQNTTCPLCKQKAHAVSDITIKTMIKKDKLKEFSNYDGFNFCKTPDCTTVYFKKEIIINQRHLIKDIGQKVWSKEHKICYCFNWTKTNIIGKLLLNKNTNILNQLKEKKKKSKCNCTEKNPSGKCCSNDIKKIIDELKSKFIF